MCSRKSKPDVSCRREATESLARGATHDRFNRKRQAIESQAAKQQSHWATESTESVLRAGWRQECYARQNPLHEAGTDSICWAKSLARAGATHDSQSLARAGSLAKAGSSVAGGRLHGASTTKSFARGRREPGDRVTVLRSGGSLARAGPATEVVARDR